MNFLFQVYTMEWSGMVFLEKDKVELNSIKD